MRMKMWKRIMAGTLGLSLLFVSAGDYGLAVSYAAEDGVASANAETVFAEMEDADDEVLITEEESVEEKETSKPEEAPQLSIE